MKQKLLRPYGKIRALVLSLVIHTLVLVGLRFAPVSHSTSRMTPIPEETTLVDLVPTSSVPNPNIHQPLHQRRTKQNIKLNQKELLTKNTAPPDKDPPPEISKNEPPKAKPLPPEPQPDLKQHLRMKMVEINQPESEKPSDNARFLSDKNRRVEKETQARYTNLEKDHPEPEPFSQPNNNLDKTPGSKEAKIAENQERKGKSVPPIPSAPSPWLKMRGRQQLPQGRRDHTAPPAPTSPDGTLPLSQKPRDLNSGIHQRSSSAQSGLSGKGKMDLNLDYKSQDRIDGQKGFEAREQARLSTNPSTSTSSSKGRFARKWQRVQSALENFIPEVQPGNQTMLGTRANPFAVYIARMHRKIHQFWGYGFIVDLDKKDMSNPMNDRSLWTMVEIVVLPNGEVDPKTMVVKSSGILPFDVAALDTVFSASPYPPTPREIRSADNKVYMHWRFHRDERQCGTFGVEPYILSKPTKHSSDRGISKKKRFLIPPLSRYNTPSQTSLTTLSHHRTLMT